MEVIRTYILPLLLAGATLYAPPRALAGTPEEAQLAGLIHSVLSAFVIGEFGGTTTANPHYNQRRTCGPQDYDDLREAAKDRTTLIAFHARCRLIETKIERLHVHGFAYLPAGSCEAIRNGIETTLAERVYAIPPEQQLQNRAVDYKGIRIDQNGAYWSYVRSSQLVATCQEDGSLRLTGRRNRDPARLAAEDASTTPMHSILGIYLLTPVTIISAVFIGLVLSRWTSVLIGAAAVAFVGHLFYFAEVLFIYPASFGGRWIAYVAATLAASLVWAAIAFALKQFLMRQIKSARRAQ